MATRGISGCKMLDLERDDILHPISYIVAPSTSATLIASHDPGARSPEGSSGQARHRDAPRRAGPAPRSAVGACERAQRTAAAGVVRPETGSRAKTARAAENRGTAGAVRPEDRRLDQRRESPLVVRPSASHWPPPST